MPESPYPVVHGSNIGARGLRESPRYTVSEGGVTVHLPHLIDAVIAEENIIKVYPNDKFKKQYLLENFFVKYDVDVEVDRLDYSIVTIPFILNVIPIVWLSGGEYSVESMDATLADSLEEIRKSFAVMYPNLEWTGRLIPNKVISNDIGRSDAAEAVADKPIAILFSGGVDSTFTSLCHSEKSQLLISIWGADVALDNKSGWLHKRKYCSDFASQYGHSNAFIRSNLFSFLNKMQLHSISPGISDWWVRIQHGLALTGLTAPLLENKQCKDLLVAATHTGEYEGGSGSHPSIDNNIAWVGVRVQHDGYDYSRQDKIRFIKDYCETHSIDKPALKVCRDSRYGSGGNCCECEKCLRTIAGLLVEGEDIAHYGFDTSVETATSLIGRKFACYSIPISPVVSAIWQTIQTRAHEVMSCSSSRTVNGVKLAPFLLWLMSFDMEEYRLQYEKRSRRHQKLQNFRRHLELSLNRFPPLYQAARRVKSTLCRWWRALRGK